MDSRRPAIAVSDLRVKRGGAFVLPGVSLAVSAGVVTGLLGPSGSGKTTLMRAIVGVQIVAAGERDGARPAGRLGRAAARVGYVTQAPSVYTDLTVRENLGTSRGSSTRRASASTTTIATVGLSAHADQVARTLSGGERSRASLAVALLGEPDAARARRADRRARPGAAPRAVGPVPRRSPTQGTTLLVSTT